jgi:hypothetical protein
VDVWFPDNLLKRLNLMQKLLKNPTFNLMLDCLDIPQKGLYALNPFSSELVSTLVILDILSEKALGFSW